MEIHVRDENKLVEVWLTNAERRDESVREKLKPLYRAYRQKNYLVAVFQSGSQNLADATSDLLCYDRNRIAQTEVEQERQTGVVLGT
ncbi:hypothetical protein [uncultured Dysosmobacter sp.]|uniref:hypothetical protein n=1 Tax=uncultured Dysosmobacter sp. TaxID=2591384 RepID=UPI00261B965A|nr:hypothetical protein [uncultured Dysosmobacter sp.]